MPSVCSKHHHSQDPAGDPGWGELNEAPDVAQLDVAVCIITEYSRYDLSYFLIGIQEGAQGQKASPRVLLRTLGLYFLPLN